MDLFSIAKMIREWQYNKEVHKAKKFTESTAEGFWATFNLAKTFHGRYMMSQIVLAAQQDEDLDIDPKVLGMYVFMLQSVPYKLYANLN